MYNILEKIPLETIIFPMSIVVGTMSGKVEIKRDIYALEKKVKLLELKENNNLDSIFNKIDTKYHYLLGSEKLQKHFKIEKTKDHSDRYNLKKFWANTTNKRSLIWGGIILPFSLNAGIGIMLGYKIGYKIAQKIEINNYVKKIKP